MLAIDRKMRLIEYIRQNRTATISALAKEFNVHEVTVRRDLAEIEQNGILKERMVASLWSNGPTGNRLSWKGLVCIWIQK